MRISAILPCYNEEENVYHAYERITAALQQYDTYEIIITDDGSSDNTLKIVKEIAAKDDCVKYISFSRNFGNCAAFRIGFLYASYEWSIQFDADLQSPPEEAHKLIDKTKEGWDVVFGIRKNRNDPLYRVLGTRFQQFLGKTVFGIEIPLGASVYRVLRTSVARDVINHPTRSQYFIATIPYVTRNFTFVETEHHQRHAGESKWKWKHIIAHTLDLYWGFSLRPLSLVWLFAVFALLVGLGSLFMSDISTKAVLVWGAFFASLQFGAVGVMGEYLKRPFTSKPYYKQIYVCESNIPQCQVDFQTRDLLL
ncbi:MAG: glycosyltransferase family 2 protein [Chloroflexi bacterium]|nr:glycosyltransferase family 2 protein [Chloroflexota bacterium]